MIDNPVGIDLPIQEMQQLFINNLWLDIPDGKKKFYHRVFNNPKDDNNRPEVFISNNNYEEVKFNKRLDVLSWFDVSEDSEDYKFGQNFKDVGIFFAVNLANLYPTLSHRAVEESHRDVVKIIQKNPLFKMPYDIIEGKGAYGDYDTNNLKAYNMQPWHVFSINCSVSYSIKC